MNKNIIFISLLLVFIAATISTVFLQKMNKAHLKKDVLSVGLTKSKVTPILTITATPPPAWNRRSASPTVVPTIVPSVSINNTVSPGSVSTSAENNNESVSSQTDSNKQTLIASNPSTTPVPTTVTPTTIPTPQQNSVSQSAPPCYTTDKPNVLIVSGNWSHSGDISECVPWADRYNYPPYNGQGSTGGGVTVENVR